MSEGLFDFVIVEYVSVERIRTNELLYRKVSSGDFTEKIILLVQ